MLCTHPRTQPAAPSVMVLQLIITIMLVAQNLRSYGSGFDAYTSCYRTSRQRPDLPCDFAAQNWCAIPGSAYPWHAVRRFVHENQGLMRRMYGDERHISVLRAELDTNEIEYFHDADAKEKVRQRYSKNMASTLLRPDARKSKAEKTKKAILHLVKDNAIGKNNFHSTGDIKNSFADLSKSTQLLTLRPQTTRETVTTSGTVTETTPLTTTAPSTIDTSTTVTTTPTESQVSQIEVSEASNHNVSDTTLQPNETQTETTDAETYFPTTDADPDAELITEEGLSEESGFAEQDNYEDSVEEEEGEDAEDAEESAPPKSPPVLRLKGINACPVKEEVVAPFWANNTRGEVLALLNLYPFEQYVHWEKCSYEHKQMFCREGCRCEQQYRLHRLLAYDPNNECRGIFSDWFRFPSCCVCKCYDVPMELRLTSRSPRSPTVSNMEPGPT